MHKKIFAKTFVVLIACAAFVTFSHVRADITPTLSVVGTGDGDTVNLTVNGDPNESVLLYYLKTGVGSQITDLGTTSSSGYFSETLSSSSYGIVTDTPVHVPVNGLTGPQSAVEYWPTVNASVNTFTLSQTGLVLSVGQSSSVTASNATGTLYMQNSSNPPVANVAVSGDEVTITGNTTGSTVVTVCVEGNTTNCPSIYVTVQNSGVQALNFSQNNVTVATGQDVPVTISGGDTGLYEISNNSNSSIVSPSISGSTITLDALGTSGLSSITVCSTDMSSCGIINVTVGTTSNSSVVTFSQTNPSITIGQDTPLTIYGPSGGTFYVSTNSNPSVVQANVSGSTLTLYGITSGSSTLTVCSSLGGCATLPLTVAYVASGGNITLSQTSIDLTSGQTLSVTVSGGTAPYSIINTSTTIAEAGVSGNLLTVTGLSSGSSLISVCSAAGGCTSLSIIVNGTGSTTTSSSLTFSQSSVALSIGQSTPIYLSGTGSYYLSNNSNSSVVSDSLSGSTLTVTGIGAGSSTISVCESSGQCGSLYVTVSTSIVGTQTTQTSGTTLALLENSISYGSPFSLTVSPSGFTNPVYSVTDTFPGTTLSSASIGSSGYLSWTPATSDVGFHTITIAASDSYGHTNNLTIVVTVTPPSQQPATTTTTTASEYVFAAPLAEGDTGYEVVQLQIRLTKDGLFTGPENGRYGPLTTAAVKKFQTLHDISALGNVGPETRAALNSGE